MKPNSLRFVIGGAVTAVVVVVCLSLVTSAYFSAREVVLSDGAAALTISRDIRKSTIELYFSRVAKEISRLSDDFVTISATYDFQEALAVEGKIDGVPGESGPYAKMLDKYTRRFEKIARNIEIDEILLADQSGAHIIFTTGAKKYFGKPLTADKNSPLAEAVTMALESKKEDRPLYHGFDKDAGAAGLAFVAAPVRDGNRVIGVVAFRINGERVGNFLKRRYGQEETIVSGVFDDKGRILFSDGQGETAGDAVALKTSAGDTGVLAYDSGDGIVMMSAYAPLHIDGQDLNLSVEMSRTDALAGFAAVKKSLLFAFIPVALALIGAVTIIFRSLFPKLEKLSEGVRALSVSGEAVSLPENDNDEIGVIYMLVNNAGRKMADIETEARSEKMALLHYIDTVEEKLKEKPSPIKQEDLDAVIRERDSIAEAFSNARAELAQIRIKIDSAGGPPKKEDVEKYRMTRAVWPEIQRRLADIADKLRGEPALPAALFATQSLMRFTLNAPVILHGAQDYTRDIFKPADMAELLATAMANLAPVAEAAGVTLETGDCAGGMTVKADVEKIRVAMENMIENAINAAGEGGVVTAKISDAGMRARFEIRDSGAGMDKTIIPKLFEGGQADKDFASGLQACRLIIRAHDGRIGADSEPGKGSMFFFEIPKITAPAQKSLFGGDEG